MESENILAVNVPNMVTITLMAIVGMLVIGLVGKAVGQAASRSAVA